MKVDDKDDNTDKTITIILKAFLLDRKGKSFKGVSSSNRDHRHDTCHSVSFGNFFNIDKTNNKLYLLMHESLLILGITPQLNLQNYFIPLPLF